MQASDPRPERVLEGRRVAGRRRSVPEGAGTAFVLGGGGVMGAAEVGMLRALREAGIAPDLVVGTSVGALNGVVVADDPSTAVERLAALWSGIEAADAFGSSLVERVATFARSRTHLHDNDGLRQLLERNLTARRFEELTVPFQCVAASIERAGARWFSQGALVPAVLASAAVPGLLPPVEIDGEHHLDGGLVHSIPIGRAVELGASRVFVLHVGRIEQPLHVPTSPWELGAVTFEIARRHRFVEELDRVPTDVEVHVLPTGRAERTRFSDPRQLRYRDLSDVAERIQHAYEASRAYLAGARADPA
jgi:NTE family protein